MKPAAKERDANKRPPSLADFFTIKGEDPQEDVQEEPRQVKKRPAREQIKEQNREGSEGQNIAISQRKVQQEEQKNNVENNTKKDLPSLEKKDLKEGEDLPAPRITHKRADRLAPIAKKEEQGGTGTDKVVAEKVPGQLAWSRDEEPDANTAVNLSLDLDRFLKKNSENLAPEKQPTEATTAVSPPGLLSKRFWKILVFLLFSGIAFVIGLMLGYMWLSPTHNPLGVFTSDVLQHAYKLVAG